MLGEYAPSTTTSAWPPSVLRMIWRLSRPDWMWRMAKYTAPLGAHWGVSTTLLAASREAKICVFEPSALDTNRSAPLAFSFGRRQNWLYTMRLPSGDQAAPVIAALLGKLVILRCCRASRSYTHRSASLGHTMRPCAPSVAAGERFRTWQLVTKNVAASARAKARASINASTPPDPPFPRRR